MTISENTGETDNLKKFDSPDLKSIVEDLRNLLSQSRLAFLLGAGCSRKAGLPLMSELTKEVLKNSTFSKETKQLLDTVHEMFSGGESATIEDYMSEIVDFLSIAERRIQRGATQQTIFVKGGMKVSSEELQKALDGIKQAVSSSIEENEVNIATHRQFVRAIHGTLQAGKADRSVDYFVLNYDTLIEDALGLERIVYSDGFAGATTGWWNPSMFEVDGEAARVFKIHGSIDWCLLEDDTLPRRVRSKIKTALAKKHVLIYPAATKYQETQRDPFAHMLGLMRQSLCPSEGKEMVLVICGYSFCDSHIDSEIENALRQSEGRLTIAAFTGTDKPEGKLKKWLHDDTISEQIQVYANKGFFHGRDAPKQGDDLSWWKFEELARLLGGER